MRKTVFITVIVFVVLGIAVWHSTSGKIDRGTKTSAKVISEEKKVLPGRMSHFISPYEDVRWASKQVEMLEKLSATNSMSSKVAANLFEHSYHLTQYLRKIKRRIALTEGSFVFAVSGDYYPLYPVGGKKVWSDLHFYHDGFLEGQVKDSQNIITTIKKKGSCIRAVDFKRKEYSHKDIPDLLRGIEKTKRHIDTFGVPSAVSLLSRLDDVRWDMR